MRARNYCLSTVFALVILACAKPKSEALPFYQTPDFTPSFLPQQQADSEVTHRIAPFALIDENGHHFYNTQLSGKIHIADFMFTTCGSICPRMTDRMKMVARAFEKDTNVAILSYSVTPWIDTPEKLFAYKKAKGITKRDWHFLTGDKYAIYKLARQSYFAEEDIGFTKDSSEFLHTEHFVLVDGDGRIRGIYNGSLETEVHQLIEDVKTLKK